MFLSKIKRFALRLTIVGILALGLILPMNPTEKRAYAAATCQECDESYASCSDSCVNQPSNCMNFCNRIYARCLSTCQ
jgi:hypothetical protein